MEYQAIRLRNRKHVRFISWVDMLIAVIMVSYFAYKFIFSDLNDVTRPPFSPGKWRGFAEFLFSSICIVYSTQFFIALLLLSSTSRTENVENACVKNQVWICVSHFLCITLAIELFILGFNLIRPGATADQIMTFGIGMGICLFKIAFRLIAEKSVKEYLADIYDVPGVHFSDSMYNSSSRPGSRHDLAQMDLNGEANTYTPYRVRSFDYDYDDEYYFEDDDKDPRDLYYDKYDVV
ncbi:uncharacterized protein LOC110856362 [Folsomia candida]|uniref:Uncharacterized protein n=1 Tax=Folsomia candida TaxID=158441 RepID=A0A226DPS6_FOLCA|nr:uncharacterized protein LOC110856362 [Folsomia candida]XP_035712843.1 uncharacterized protein LOC110856362 [Folsomia candida]XP_035712844.1 uncharacterized protein LOC110856362 [Folsomia candida]XP_035712845.1 uncharacterized protein LOC110856362 [Folsomia candida]XP_035712846.1 uncharacterized protein LOC110856362 [Folsomia candida]OXA46667.1 hypothetical protein Fcan01_18729 [Folsomia candida]